MDWVKRGWGKDYSSEFSPDLEYHISFPDAVEQDWQTASKKAINNIIKKYPPPYNLMVSGGVDSQAMLWLWMQSGKPFIPVTARYWHNNHFLNIDDFIALDKFATRHNLDLDYIDIDIIDFFENELETYARLYYCNSPQICTHMKITEDLNGTVIFSGNFKSDFIYTTEQLGVMFYADITGRSIIPFFLMYSNALANSIDTHPPRGRASADIAKKLKTVHNIDIPSHIVGDFHKFRYQQNYYKALCLLDHGFAIEVPETKYNGFERVRTLCEKIYSVPKSKVSVSQGLKVNASRRSKGQFDLKFTYPLQDNYPHKSSVIYT